MQCYNCIYAIEEELDRLYCGFHKEDVTDKEEACKKFIEF